MKKILGLDIGTTSIGWAIVEASETKKINERTNEVPETDINNDRIGIHKDAVGVRIISQDATNLQSFNKGEKLVKGSTLTPTANRRVKRGSRRLKSRYKLRRGKLENVLSFLGITKDEKYYTNERKNDVLGKRIKRGQNNDIGKAIYELRDRAIREKISLPELGRILLHLNQWRGYSSDRFAIKEKKFDYNVCEITNIDWDYRKAIYDKNDKEKKEPKYYEVTINLKFEDSIKVNYEIENNGTKEEITTSINEVSNGIIYLKKELKVGTHITVKVPKYTEVKDKKGNITNRYVKIEKTEPDPEDTDYQRIIFNKTLSDFCNTGGTVGSYFYKKHYIERVENSRIRNNIVDRDWYEQEFDKIWKFQFENHKDFFEKINIDEVVKIAFKDYQAILNEIKKNNDIQEQLKCLIKDKIIFYQRPWQQAKNKGQCKFEFVPDVQPKKDETGKIVYDAKGKIIFEANKKGKRVLDKNGNEIFLKGRTVIPKSHPLYQEFRIWQKINDCRIFLNTPDETINLFATPKIFEEIFNKNIETVKNDFFYKLQNAKSASWLSFAKDELGVRDFIIDEVKDLKKGYYQFTNKETGEIQNAFFTVNFRKRKKDGSYDDIKLKGNCTKKTIKDVLVNFLKKEKYLITELDKQGKEVIKEDKADDWFNKIHTVSKSQNITNLQLLWEIIYDISETKTEKIAATICKDKDGKKNFPELAEYADSLSKIRFDDTGMGDISAKAIRNILPLMSNGNNITPKAEKRIQSLLALNNIEKEKTKDEDEKLSGLKNFISDKKSRIKLSKLNSENDFKYLSYTEAAAVVYGSHSTKNTQTQSEIVKVKQHSLNNPIVEKIVNETISIVNEIYNRYAEKDSDGNILIDENGKPKMGFDEVRIELCRELKSSMDERQQMDEAMRNNAKRNELAKRMLRELFNADISINNIDKLKIYEDEAKQMTKERFEELKNKGEIKKETDFEKFEDIAKKLNLKEPSKADITRYQLWLDQMCQCPYTGEIIRLSDVFTSKYEIEHIIPKERYLDNSYSNKVITRKIINKWKDNRLAYEFIIQEGGKTKKDNSDNKELKILELDKKTNEGSYKELITRLFSKGRKLQNLLRKEPPEDPINRELKDTQYINKKLKEKLAELVGESKVWTTTGSITDILRESWHLNDVMKELLRDRYKDFKITLGSGKEPTYGQFCYEDTKTNKKTEKEEPIEIFPGYSKRLDHRHHALDAFIIACTKQWHIQYINTMNAANSADISIEEDKKNKAVWLKHQVCKKNDQGDYKSSDFIYPWEEYNKSQIGNLLKEVVVVHKNTNTLISQSKHRIKKNGEILTVKRKDGSIDRPISIRGQMHNETIIGKRKFYNPEKKTIEKIIEEIFSKRQSARNNLKPVQSFDELIEQIVFKEKFQKKLKEIFKINLTNDEYELQQKIKQFVRENKKDLFDWATTINFLPVKTGTDKQGGIDKIDVNNVTDLRIRRYLKYRKDLITSIEEKKELLRKEKSPDEEIKKWEAIEKDVKNFTTYPIYYNAIYDVRIPSIDRINPWVPLEKLTADLILKIEYIEKRNSSKNRTDAIKQIATNYLNSKQTDSILNKIEYLIYNPLFKSLKTIKIPIKKASIFNKTKEETLYPIRPGAFVELANNFMVYMFEKSDNNSKERAWNLLTIIDALHQKLGSTEKINNENLFPNELIPQGFHQIFTLSKKEIVFIPFVKGKIEKEYSKEELSKLFDWTVSDINTASLISEKKKIVVSNLWQVSQFSKTSTGSSINFRRINTAKEISIPIIEIKTDKGNLTEDAIKKIEKTKLIFSTSADSKKKKENSTIDEDIIPYDQILFQNCVKVFTDKLGKKIVPYWEFKNGCWDRERAKELGIIV